MTCSADGFSLPLLARILPLARAVTHCIACAWQQVGEQDAFIVELLNNLTPTIQDLENHQIHMFYETVGLMISADTDGHRDPYLVRSCAPALILVG